MSIRMIISPMEVLVKLHYVLRAYAPKRDFKKTFPLVLANDAVLGDVVAALGLPNDQNYLLFIGSERARKDRLLTEGDTITILPPVIGG